MITIRTFGIVEVRDAAGNPVAVAPKPLALLFYLALARPSGPQRREQLAALFYPDSDDTRARQALRQLLAELRAALGPDVLANGDRQTAGVARAALDCDVWTFEQALATGDFAAAVAAYGGPLLEGFHLTGCPAFEDWVAAERMRLRRTFTGALEQLALRASAEGRPQEAADWWRRLLAHEPYASSVTLGFMEALTRAGDRAGALAAAQAHAQRLREELGATPSAEVEALAARLQREPVAHTGTTPTVEERLAAALADRYRLEGLVAVGGMALVYKAQDLQHDRPVAIKVLRPELGAALGPDRFLKEVAVTAQLDHPGIVPVLDSGRADGQTGGWGDTANDQVPAASLLYFVMPFIEGESLRARLEREGPLPLEDALRITREVADALGYAHGKEIIHRDIKPENVLLTPARALVTDFGIARALEQVGGSSATAPGVALGTPAYMSPEQAAARDRVDARSDVYALGCVLYELLAGHPPFHGTTAQELLSRHAVDPLPSLRSARRAVPEPIEAAVEKALAKVPADRFATAKQFSKALDIDATALRSRQRRTQWVMRAGVAVAGLIVLTTATIGLARYRAVSDWRRVELDPDAVAIMPFEVRATDPQLATLDESIIDFLYPILSGDAGPRAVEPNPLLLALKDRQDRGEWASADGPLRLAAQFRASHVLEGRVAQIGKQLTLNAWLRRVPDGATVARSTVSGPVDSLYALIPRIAVELLGNQLGESAERLATLVGRPTESLTAYLAGVRALRAARYDDAIRELQRAVEVDSTFALAALRTAQVPLGDRRYAPIWRALDVARTHRASLGRREQAELTYQRVTNRHDTVATFVDRLRAVRAWLALAPDEPDAWLDYAGALRWVGPAIPIPGWETEWSAALMRAWLLDSSTAYFVSAHVSNGLAAENLEWVRRVGPRYLALTDSTTSNWMGNRWAIAVALGDSATVRHLRTRAAAGDPEVANWDVSWTLKLLEDIPGLPRSDGGLVAAQARARVLTPRDSTSLGRALVVEGYEKGKLRQLADALTGPPGLKGWWNGRKGSQTFLIDFWLMYPGLDSVAALAAESIRVWAEEPAPRYVNGVPITQPEYLRCYYLLYRAAVGDTIGVRETARALRPWFAEYDMVGVCPALVEALVEAYDQPRDEAPALDSLESLLRLGTDWEFPSNAAVPVLARLLRQRGEYRRALAVARIHIHGTQFALQRRVALLKEEGDLAAIVGDTAGAIEAYTRYLTFRTDPDDLARPQVDSVQAALDGLLEATR